VNGIIGEQNIRSAPFQIFIRKKDMQMFRGKMAFIPNSRILLAEMQVCKEPIWRKWCMEVWKCGVW
jgi:hypothetical protein